MNVKTTMTMVIAMVAMISLTGLASAGTTMDYNVNFDSSGDGSFNIWTNTPVGTDFQGASWTNCHVKGYQDGKYTGSTWAEVDRKTTITGLQNGNPAEGDIFTQSIPVSPSGCALASVTTSAYYYDNDAYGSHVMLKQDARLYDGDMVASPDTGYEYVDVNTKIEGYAYGDDDTKINGSVGAMTDGNWNVLTYVGAEAHNGGFTLNADSLIRDLADDTETSRTDFTVNAYDNGFTYGGIETDFADTGASFTHIYTAGKYTTGYLYAVRYV